MTAESQYARVNSPLWLWMTICLFLSEQNSCAFVAEHPLSEFGAYYFAHLAKTSSTGFDLESGKIKTFSTLNSQR